MLMPALGLAVGAVSPTIDIANVLAPVRLFAPIRCRLVLISR
jgi:hypothetical protein